MYCTLQEAYNVPSFDPQPRKKRCSPDAQAKASADSYDPYRRDGGNGTGDFTMYRYATPKQIPSQEPIQGSRPLQRRIPYETFKNREDKDAPVMRAPYKGLQADRDQYCKAYGVCSADQMEAFTNPEDRCPAGSDFYEVPLSDKTKEQFRKAMDTSLDQTTTATEAPAPKLRYDDLNQVTGYYDEDLEQYLKNSEVNRIPQRFPMNPDAKPSEVVYNPQTSPLQQTLQRFSESSIRDKLKMASTTLGTEKESKAGSSYGWDLALFILAGLLIILLIDQLFKMGVMLGMRHTIELMDPFMHELRQALKKD